MKLKSHLKLFFRQNYGNEYAAKVLYGTILLFVALLGLNASGISSGYLASTEVFIALVAIIIAEDYAELIGFTIKNKRVLNKRERHEIFEDTFAITTFCLPPVIILLFSESGLYDLNTAFIISYIYCVSILFVFSYYANILSNYSRLRSFVTAAAIACTGLMIVILKYSFGK